jgi:mannose-6-phosphate isomerase
MTALRPFLLDRLVQPKVWGGRELTRMFGAEHPEPIGETWELYDRPEGSSAVRGGGTLHALLAGHSEALLGQGVATAPGGRFPLLLKFIDAQQALSVQVHPDDAEAEPKGDAGKTEAWVVLEAGDDARICRGFRPGVTAERFAAAVHAAAAKDSAAEPVADLLHDFRPTVGDCIFVPAGTVHAIGPGVVLFEVQQSSDITYRIYDWGRDRPMHIVDGLAVSRITDGSLDEHVEPVRRSDGGLQLLQTPWFGLRRYALQEPQSLATAGRFAVVTVVSGEGRLGWQGSSPQEDLPLVAGDCAVVPACVSDFSIQPAGRIDVLVTDPGTA